MSRRQPGRRGFVAALLVLVGLTALAVATRAGGQSDESTDTQAARSAVRDRQEMNRLKGALWPLLQYVREGQPRDALKELSAASGSAVGPAVMRSIQDGATSALTNLDQLDQTATSSGQSLRLIKAATSLYAEAAGLAADASDGVPATSRIALATMGDRLLRFADALFDQARRMGKDDLIPPSAVLLDPPEAVPDIGPSLSAEAEQLAVTLAKPGSARGDLDRPQRLRVLARTVLDVDGRR